MVMNLLRFVVEDRLNLVVHERTERR
jgi:hypothetical protein